MASYKYTLYDYHAVAQAEIALEGITVLAGENGCGKSTLSRWLYFIANCSAGFEEILFEDYKSELRNLLGRLRMAARDVSRYVSDFSYNDFVMSIEAISEVRYEEENSDGQVFSVFKSSLSLFIQGLTMYLQDSKSESRIVRMSRFLELQVEEGKVRDSLEDFQTAQVGIAEVLLAEYRENVIKRPYLRFFELLRSKYRLSEQVPQRVQLAEDGVKILRKEGVGNLLGIDRAIYVDTPMALSGNNTYGESVYWQDLKRRMLSGKPDRSSAVLKLLLRIRRLINGDVVEQKNTYGQSELHFLRKGDHLDIKLSETATGMKSFAYIQRLLENGHLDAKTLLLIDEPEAHLHPKWIFEFARLLVLLNKELGVKVMVASHNPDMVAALQRIVQVEEMEDRTHFYQAIRQDEGYQYIYKDLGISIVDIFRSFNIATTRIQDYGQERPTIDL